MQKGKGSPIVGARLPEALYAALVADLERYNSGPVNSERTLTDHVRALLAEGLRKRKASRARRRVKPVSGAEKADLIDYAERMLPD